MKFSKCERRKDLSQDFASGAGLELAPLNAAWPIHEGMKVRYVDRYTREELIQQYPELEASGIAETDTVDDARTLKSIVNNSQDFILHSHLLEHCDNPLMALERWLEVTKVGGVILGAVPNKDCTFDRDRPITPFEELKEAYSGSRVFKLKALGSFFRHIEKLEGDALAKAVSNAMEKDLHVHFPVWDRYAFRDFLSNAHSVLKFGYQVEKVIDSGGEILFALRRMLP